MNEVKGEIPSMTNLATNASFNGKIDQVKNEIPNITNLATTTTALTVVENKIPDDSKYINTAENFTARLKQSNLVNKGDIADFVKKRDFDDKLKKLNEKVSSNKLKYSLFKNEFKKSKEKNYKHMMQVFLLVKYFKRFVIL